MFSYQTINNQNQIMPHFVPPRGLEPLSKV
nr:MAG TPA: hypothetical protein [Crassvirales sp.]